MARKWGGPKFSDHANFYTGLGGSAYGCKRCGHVEKTGPRRNWGDVAKARGRMIQHLKAAHNLTGE